MRHEGGLKSDAPKQEVYFYFFDKQRPLTNLPGAAFRAIATQILHSWQELNDFVDLAIFLKGRGGSGQNTASDDEVRNLLSCYLEKLDGSRLVLDGLDECSDPQALLSQLQRVTAKSRTHVMLWTRPSVTVECQLGTTKRQISLNELSNYNDIISYIQPEMQKLMREEKIILDQLEEVSCGLAMRSNSMFLWASLMISYLNSDFLTPQDRTDAIEEFSLFEELEQLYDKILRQLYQRCRGAKGRINLQRLFNILSTTFRPLTSSELRCAMAIHIGSPTKRSGYITNFESTVVKMSGALAEVGKDRTVRFVHASVFEFFTQPGAEAAASERPAQRIISVNLQSSHGSLAAECLSYLLYDVPNQPLKQTFSSRPQMSAVLKRFPLTFYATQFWALHVERYLSDQFQICAKPGGSLTAALVRILATFLRDPLAVTIWTELAWTFRIELDLGNLSQQLKATETVESDIPSSLAAFSKDLRRLNTDWGHVLRESPGEIWQPSIPAFLKSPFWVGTKATTVLDLDCNTAAPVDADVQPDSICVASQTSADGLEVGVIKIWPSKYASTDSFSSLNG